ncbi:hypothetical protein [Bacillus sp. SM2101]|uniref:hypothetical protein n=1 Tax=Bacillus sp. SM2101 TaxID=2805366 RepID=UPI001BDEE36E|nr:hypothetical protein [Bacillus sp. SM2101]
MYGLMIDGNLTEEFQVVQILNLKSAINQANYLMENTACDDVKVVQLQATFSHNNKSITGKVTNRIYSIGSERHQYLLVTTAYNKVIKVKANKCVFKPMENEVDEYSLFIV